MIAPADPGHADGLPAQIASFRLGDEWFGVDVLAVQEVLRPMRVTAVPEAPPEVIGLINVRGLIVTVLSLKARLGFSDAAYGEDHRNLVVDTSEGPVCLAVDEIGDVLPTRQDDLRERPSTVAPALRDHLLGILRCDQRLVSVLDVRRLASP